MKTTIILSVLLAIGLVACNQGGNKKANAVTVNRRTPEEIMANAKFDSGKIYGIGIFKVGATVENTIGQLMNSKKYTMYSVSNFDEEMSSKEVLLGAKQIFKVTPSLTTSINDMIALKQHYGIALWCKKVSIFTIVSYDIDNISLHKLLIKYYDDKLIYVECDVLDGEIARAIHLKYGEPENTSGAPDAETENGWYDNGEVAAGFVPGKCFKVYVKGANQFIKDCGEKGFATQDTIDKANKVKQLKNL